MKLKINYQCTSIQNLVALKNKYDVIVALELLEHVNNLKEFCKLITNLLTDDGIIILSTINKTFLSKLFVIDMAEKILKSELSYSDIQNELVYQALNENIN